MAKEVKYKKPRKINVVSVSLVLILSLLGFLAYQYIPASLRKGEAYRVLDETASKFAARHDFFEAERDRLAGLKSEMNSHLRLVGIVDPQMETWIEVDSAHQARFGVLYSEWTTWPFDMIEKQERIYELEYTVEY